MGSGVVPLDVVDRDAVVALWERCGLTRPWNDPYADLDRALAGPASTVLVVPGPAGPLGAVMVGHDGHRGWLYYLAVDEARRRRGTGRVLVEGAERWLAEHVPKVQLMVRSDNPDAVGFWVRLGYEASDVTVLGRRVG